jgi:ABC-type nitrate/sulfonate/bicarbonate transport system substrate-binding protein
MTPDPDVIWYSRCPSPTASSIAITGGWLAREFDSAGLAVRSLRAAGDRSVRQTHFTQQHDALFRQGGIVPPLWAAAHGTATRLIGVTEIPRFQGVISLPGTGIEGPADLRGRRLALPRRTAEPVDFWRAHTWRGLLRALELSGIAEDEVTWVDLPTDAPYHVTATHSLSASLWTAREAARLQTPEVLALVRGDVDAIYTYAPTGVGLLELLGANVVVSLPPRGPDASGMGTLSVLTVSQRLLDDRPDVVVRYMRALLRAADWAVEHQEETWRIFAAEEGVPEEWAAESFGGDSPLDLRPDLRPHLLLALQREADFLSGRGLIPAPVDVEAWSDPSPLRVAQELGQKEPA